MDGGDLPGFYHTRGDFFVYNRYGVGGRLRRPFRGRAFLRDSFFCGASPPTSPAQSGIVTDSCLAALSSVVSGGLAALGV